MMIKIDYIADCGSECRGFEPHQSPSRESYKSMIYGTFFL